MSSGAVENLERNRIPPRIQQSTGKAAAAQEPPPA
jgi:hypothetical protein